MIGGAMVTTIQTLWKRCKNKSEIARVTGHDWKTVAKAVKLMENGGAYPSRKPHPRILDAKKEEIIQWLKKGLTGVRIHEELKSMGVEVGYSTVKEYIAKIKKRENIFVRVHTKPGEEAQVDFGYVGLTNIGNDKKRKTWVFNMRLSYSRLDYYEKVYDQRIETFIQCHINAFKYFGGVPEYVKIDNLKAAILEANFYEPVYQRLYIAFADYYGFKPIPCRIYSPNDKGKVESGVQYVQSNFFLGRKFKDGDELDKKLRNWLDNKCNMRIHGTTRKVPREIFDLEEKHLLRPLPASEFKMLTVGSRKVYHDCHIYVDYNYYSVPFEYVGKEVDIELGEKTLKIFYKGKEIAMHIRLAGKGEFSTSEAHYPKYKMMSETEYQEKYQSKMSEIGPYAEQLFFAIKEKNPRDWYRSIQGILSLVKSYPKEVVELSCKRALVYGALSYRVIKNICYNGSYKLPVEFNNNGGINYEYVDV